MQELLDQIALQAQNLRDLAVAIEYRGTPPTREEAHAMAELTKALQALVGQIDQ